MAGIQFEGLPEYSWPGGSIAGTLVLEIDRPARGRDLVLLLHGREISEKTISTGKSAERIVQTVPVLELGYDLNQSLTFLDPEHLAPATYRVPFRFDLPPSMPPSFQTREWAGPSGTLSQRPDGMYVEYEIEGRLDVPWWLDRVTRTLVPVYSARRVLGTLPDLVSAPSPSHPSIAVRAGTAGPVLPGEPLAASYQILNPTGKTLRRLTLSLARVTEYATQGFQSKFAGPTFSSQVPLGGHDPSYSGLISLDVPNTADTTGPWQGSLFRTYWVATALLDVELGFDVEVQGPLIPA